MGDAQQAREARVEDLIENVRIRLSWVPPGHAKDAHSDLDALSARVSSLTAERDTLRDALVGLKFVTDCWCDLDPDHDYGCLAAQAAVSSGNPSESETA
jgi:hypothetical protein